jgi:hypothetical protein
VREWAKSSLHSDFKSLSLGSQGKPPRQTNVDGMLSDMETLEVGAESDGFYELKLVLKSAPSVKKALYESCVFVKASSSRHVLRVVYCSFRVASICRDCVRHLSRIFVGQIVCNAFRRRSGVWTSFARLRSRMVFAQHVVQRNPNPVLEYAPWLKMPKGQ